jgi:hypothetical protein
VDVKGEKVHISEWLHGFYRAEVEQSRDWIWSNSKCNVYCELPVDSFVLCNCPLSLARASDRGELRRPGAPEARGRPEMGLELGERRHQGRRGGGVGGRRLGREVGGGDGVRSPAAGDRASSWSTGTAARDLFEKKKKRKMRARKALGRTHARSIGLFCGHRVPCDALTGAFISCNSCHLKSWIANSSKGLF